MLSKEQMLSAFVPLRQPYHPLVGFEYEIQLFRQDTGAPLGYSGPGGLREVLERAEQLTGGTLYGSPGEPPTKVTLPDQSQLSIEPGGQFEFSSSPMERFQDALTQLDDYLKLLNELMQTFRLRCFFGGVNPVHTVDQIGLVTPTRRYALMDAYLPTVGSMGRRMMRQTCSMQISFDYRDQVRGGELLRTAQYVAPVAAALFANSPYLEGRRTDYRTYRVPIWADTDPSRCGPLPGFTDPHYGFGHYLDHVLAAPLLFVQHEGGLEPAGGMTFAELNQRGYKGRAATMDDFLLHNSTMFNDVRLKHTVEVRTVDSQHPALVPALLAFFAGILHCQRSRLRVRHLLDPLSEAELAALPDRLAREGLTGEIRGAPTHELALELIELAAQGLPTCFPDGAEATSCLEPIRTLAAQRKCPADVVLERYGDDPRGWLEAGGCDVTAL